MNGIKEALTKKLGPLPVWVYAIGGAVLVMFFLKSKGVTAGDSTLALATQDTNTNANNPVAPYDPILGGGIIPYEPAPIGPTLPEDGMGFFSIDPPILATGGNGNTPTPKRLPLDNSGSPAIPAGKRVDSSNPTGANGPGTGGGEVSWVTPIGAVLTQVFGARAKELNVGDKSVVQNINGEVFSLDQSAIDRGGIPASDLASSHPSTDPTYHTYYGPDNMNAVKVPTGSETLTEHVVSNGALVAKQPTYQVNGAAAPTPDAANLAFLRSYGYPG